MPVNAMAMPYLLHVSMTLSSRIEPPGCCNKFYAALVRALNVVAEREERVAATETPLNVASQAAFSSRVNTSGFSVKNCCQTPSAQHVVMLLTDVHVNGVVAVRTADALLKRQIQHLLVLTQIPDVRLVARKTRAVDAVCWPAPMPMA